MRWFWRGMSLVHAMLFVSACGVTDTDEPTPIESVAVTPPSMQLTAGTTGALDAEVRDAAGNVVRDRRVVWATANPAIATVSDNGVVTGIASGRVDIAATAEGKSAIASVTVVSAPIRVASIRISPDRVSLFVAASANLVATAYDSQGATIGGRVPFWMTNNAGVAAVSQTGRVTGLLPGTAVITAVIDGVSNVSNVTVTLAPVARVTVSPPDVSVTAGKSVQLTANLADASGNALSGRDVAWESSDTRLATVDQNGLVRGIRRGTAIVTARSEGKAGTATIRVQ
jgi:trimeric autotransporter adhesin